VNRRRHHPLRAEPLLLAFCLIAASQAQAQSLLSVTASVAGRTVDGTLSFSGSASINTITHQGTIKGRASNGSRCQGTVEANFAFSHGEGVLRCGPISCRFTFSLASRAPPAGSGTGTLSDGRKVTLTIGG
jgi:hypothetical protein